MKWERQRGTGRGRERARERKGRGEGGRENMHISAIFTPHEMTVLGKKGNKFN